MSLEILAGNCLDILPTMPDSSVDMVFTSPPFKEEDVDGDYWTFYDRFYQEAFRVCRKVLVIIHSSSKMKAPH